MEENKDVQLIRRISMIVILNIFPLPDIIINSFIEISSMIPARYFSSTALFHCTVKHILFQI